MAKELTDFRLNITGEQLIQLLNDDLAREYQALMAYTVYSQVHEGAAFPDIARELEAHAREELNHALLLARQIDSLGGMPGVTPRPIVTSNDPVVMLQANLENKRDMVRHYHERILQAEAVGEYPLSVSLRAIVAEEHLQELHLSAALGLTGAQPSPMPDRNLINVS